MCTKIYFYNIIIINYSSIIKYRTIVSCNMIC